MVPVENMMEKALARCPPMVGNDDFRMPLGMPHGPSAFQLGM